MRPEPWTSLQTPKVWSRNPWSRIETYEGHSEEVLLILVCCFCRTWSQFVSAGLHLQQLPSYWVFYWVVKVFFFFQRREKITTETNWGCIWWLSSSWDTDPSCWSLVNPVKTCLFSSWWFYFSCFWKMRLLGLKQTKLLDNMETFSSAEGSVSVRLSCSVFTLLLLLQPSSACHSVLIFLLFVLCRLILAVCVSRGGFNVSVNFLCCCCVTAFWVQLSVPVLIKV